MADAGADVPAGEGEGVAKETYKYEPDGELSDPDEVTNGVVMTTLRKNVIYISTDWRHMGDVEAVLRQILDYYDKNGGTDIPIELAEFEATAVSNRVDLRWVTASELNSERFDVERAELSKAGKGSFYKIAEEAAAGLSSVSREYSIADRNVEYGKVYIYRLKMVDKDGRYAYSDERMVEIGGEGLWLSEARPNPVRDVARFDISTGGRQIELYLYDMNGRKIVPGFEINDGVMELDISGVGSGVYTLILSAGEVMMTRQLQVVK